MAPLLKIILLAFVIPIQLDSEGIEKKIHAELPIGIYKGSAYQKWYMYNRDKWTGLEKDQATITEEMNDPAMESFYKLKQKGDRREARAKVIQKIKMPFSFVLKPNDDPDLPWQVDRIEVKDYEDEVLKVQVSELEYQNTSSQNMFRFRVRITNKHKKDSHSVNYHFSLMINYENGKFSTVSASGGGTIYCRQYPYVYKKRGIRYSFVPLYDRFEQDVREKTTLAFQEN